MYEANKISPVLYSGDHDMVWAFQCGDHDGLGNISHCSFLYSCIEPIPHLFSCSCYRVINFKDAEVDNFARTN